MAADRLHPRHLFVPNWWERDAHGRVARNGPDDPEAWFKAAYRNQSLVTRIGTAHADRVEPGTVVRRPWKTLAEVELATVEWIDWYNFRRLHGEIGHVPPAEYEASYHQKTQKPQVTTTI